MSVKKESFWKSLLSIKDFKKSLPDSWHFIKSQGKFFTTVCIFGVAFYAIATYALIIGNLYWAFLQSKSPARVALVCLFSVFATIGNFLVILSVMCAPSLEKNEKAHYNTAILGILILFASFLTIFFLNY